MGEKIPIGSDHAGYEMKQDLIEYLGELGYEPEDMPGLLEERVRRAQETGRLRKE